jgi:hypothetical protein
MPWQNDYKVSSCPSWYYYIDSLKMAGIPGVSAFPETDNMLQWIGTIQGPEHTVH